MTICLSMIVKNEAHVIVRCLKSMLPFIDCWCIVDTGSTDGTQQLIRDTFQDLCPGLLYERPWIDFATNRTQALVLARATADYTFVMDADDEVVSMPIKIEGLSADAYTVEFSNQGTSYRRIALVKNTLPWRYRGVVHEFLEAPDSGIAHDLPLTVRCLNDGARAQDPTKYLKDAEILEAAFDTEKDPMLKARYGFYLAQSYRDCGLPEKALTWYQWRAKQEFWIEEVYISRLNAARIAATVQPEIAADLYHEAIDTRPNRAEAYYSLAKLHRSRSEHEEGYRVAQRAVELTQWAGSLFVETWVYDWGILDELSINAYWAGHYRLALDAGELIYAQGKCPDMDRIITNANFARRKLLLRSQGD